MTRIFTDSFKNSFILALITFLTAFFPSKAQEFAIGADLSFLAAAEGSGFQFKEDGKAKPGLEIFREHGYNWVRLRLFHTPTELPNDLGYTIALAQEAKKLGYKFLLDLHYSDTWADPGKQFIPLAWEGKSHGELVAAVRDYTRDVIVKFEAAGVMPDMVQPGNEVINGMLWPDGSIPENWDNFIDLLRAGIEGIYAGCLHKKVPLIMIHIDQGGNKDRTKYFFDKINEYGIDFDVIGQSYYPWWHGSLSDLRENMDFMAKEYKKPIMLVEVAYCSEPTEYKANPGPFPETPEGQRQFLEDVTRIVIETPDNLGTGIMWWEPATAGLGHVGARDFFDDDGNVLPVINVFDKYTRPVAPQLFNDNWQFILSADSAEVFKPQNTLAWETVRLPHTPVIEPLIVNNQWQGTCWYRKEFMLPPEAAGKNLFLRFEGAMNVAEVWVNGVKKITHLGGYLPFVVDFTAEAVPGELNRVTVRLDNTDNPVTGPKPLKQLDFNMYSGLYRDVSLIIKNDVFITDPIFENTADAGIFVTYPEVGKEKAVIKVRTHVKNTGNGREKITVRHHMLNTGVDAEFCASTAMIQTDSISTIIIDLPNPKLWSPTSPNLYDLVTEVYSDGLLSDTDTTRIGIRRFEISRERFAINGEEMFLRGVNRHQEYPYIGYALSNNAQYRDARKIKDAGFDYVRLSHYPHSPAFMDACDELGLLVLDAIPGWQYYSEDPAFHDQVIRTCRDMVRRDRNHACVLAWEVSLNESWMQEAFIDRAIAAAREEYPGDQCFTAGWMEYGYDIYLQARQHRLEHYKDPVKPYIVSEYGDWEYYAMNAGLAQHEWAGLKQEERSSRQLLGSGEKRLLQQVANIAEAHNDNFNTPAFADGYWVMFDYNRGYTDDLEASGIMSIFRVPKFSYYFFRSQRSPEETSPLYTSGPMVKIASYDDDQSGPNYTVFSNCDRVWFTQNDENSENQGPDTGKMCDNLAHPPFTFKTTGFSPGKIAVTGYFHENNIQISDTVKTPGLPAGLRLHIDESGRPPQAGVNDVLFVHAEILDKDGNLVPVTGPEIHFGVKGDAEIINPGSTAISEAGIATALVRIGENKGEISITAQSERIISGEIKFNSY